MGTDEGQGSGAVRGDSRGTQGALRVSDFGILRRRFSEGGREEAQQEDGWREQGDSMTPHNPPHLPASLSKFQIIRWEVPLPPVPSAQPWRRLPVATLLPDSPIAWKPHCP